MRKRFVLAVKLAEAYTRTVAVRGLADSVAWYIIGLFVRTRKEAPVDDYTVVIEVKVHVDENLRRQLQQEDPNLQDEDDAVLAQHAAMDHIASGSAGADIKSVSVA